MISKLLDDFGFISKLSETLRMAVEISFIEAYRLIPGESKLYHFSMKRLISNETKLFPSYSLLFLRLWSPFRRKNPIFRLVDTKILLSLRAMAN